MATGYMRDLQTLCEAEGLTIEHGSKHLRLVHPDGWFVNAPCSPRDRDGRTTLKRIKSDMKYARAGTGRWERIAR